MGLFDKFRKKVRKAASEVDSNSLSAEEGSDEALEALSHQEQLVQAETQHNTDVVSTIESETPGHTDDDDWEDFDEEEELQQVILNSFENQ